MMLQKLGSKYETSMWSDKKRYRLQLSDEDIEDVKSRLAPRENGMLDAGLAVFLPPRIVEYLYNRADWEQA